MPLDEIRVGLKLPFLELAGVWSPDESERTAAWEMYVELITRISVAELREDEGLLREALSSLYSLFGTTRAILRAHGPSVARPKKRGDNSRLSFGYIAVAVLNAVLRPTLAKWHPLLQEHENARAPGVSAPAHERGWARSTDLRRELNDVRRVLIAYADLLAQAADVPSLIIERPA